MCARGHIGSQRGKANYEKRLCESPLEKLDSQPCWMENHWKLIDEAKLTHKKLTLGLYGHGSTLAFFALIVLDAC